MRKRVNLLMICKDLDPEDIRYALQFKHLVEQLNQERRFCEVYIKFDESVENVEVFMERRIANFKM